MWEDNSDSVLAPNFGVEEVVHIVRILGGRVDIPPDKDYYFVIPEIEVSEESHCMCCMYSQAVSGRN